MKITFVTSNAGKAAELKKLLVCEIEILALNLAEIQSLNLKKVASEKAKSAYEILKSPVIVDDSALKIDEFGELPGPFIKYFLKEIGAEKIAKMLGGNRRAEAQSALAFCDENGVKIALGKLNGKISQKSRGENGFGFDSIFIPNGENRTLAEMSADEKNLISARSLAAKKMREILEGIEK